MANYQQAVCPRRGARAFTAICWADSVIACLNRKGLVDFQLEEINPDIIQDAEDND